MFRDAITLFFAVFVVVGITSFLQYASESKLFVEIFQFGFHRPAYFLNAKNQTIKCVYLGLSGIMDCLMLMFLIILMSQSVYLFVVDVIDTNDYFLGKCQSCASLSACT